MWNGMFPTDKNAQESFQSARVPVSQAGTCSDCVWTSETRNGVKKKRQQETREVTELWHRGTSQSHEGHREILWVSLLPISHEATGRGGWAWKWISLPYGISHGFWVETTDHLLRTLYVSGSWLGWTCLREHLARSGGLWVITAWDGC